MILYGTGHTAKLLGISVEAVQRLCIAGKLDARRVKNKWRISLAAIAKRKRYKLRRVAKQQKKAA